VDIALVANAFIWAKVIRVCHPDIRRLSLKGSPRGTITGLRRYGRPSPKHADDNGKEEGDAHHHP